MRKVEILGAAPAERRKIAQLIEKSASPSLARANLLRLAENGGLKKLDRFPPIRLPDLIRLLGASSYLSDNLARLGKNWAKTFLSQIDEPQKSASVHFAEISAALGDGGSLENTAKILRRHKQREFLRIGARDLRPDQAVEETMRELTALAEASLEIACRECRREVEEEFGALKLPETERENGFVVLGMGKLGGGELNFSSDIDVVYLYESDDGESEGGRRGKAGPRAFFAALAEKVTRMMGEVMEEGFVFRTDLRLRPLGRHGPTVQSLDSALLYYESWGQCWERSALIKARPVAGDKELGEAFLRQVEPFIYRRYLDFATVEELREMKARIEMELLTPETRRRNVKLGTGGIREIEFFAQALQLVNGGYEPRIRERNTQKALALLARCDYIPAREAKSLGSAYRFLRDVEHKIQMVQEAQSHLIPEEVERQSALARRLGYRRKGKISERQLFWRDYRRHTAAVRSAFERLFYGAEKEISSHAGAAPGGIWNDLDDEPLVRQELGRLGFAEPERAYLSLLAVRDGESYSPPGPKRLKIMRRLGPMLLDAVLRSAAPDQALFNLAEFSRRIGARTGFLSLLAENPKATELLVKLFAGSRLLSDLFIARPELLDSLILADLARTRKTKEEMLRELTAAPAGNQNLEAKLNAMRRLRAEEFLRVGLHDFGGALKLEEIFDQLTDLSEACLETALRLALQEMEKSYGRICGGRFAVIGMGKLGGRELDYNSDLDLIFIYAAAEEARSEGGASGRLDPHDYYVRLGQKLLTFLSAPMQEGVAYKIDMRLRPSGRFGPLVSSLEAFQHYHRTSSELWERQALIKFRLAAGEPSLGREAEEVARGFAYGRGLTAEGVAQIDHLRMRMENELARESEAQFNLKKGMGGLVDIEFLTQMLQLAHGRRHRALRRQTTLEALRALRERKIIGAEEYRLLSEGYLFLRRLDHRLRLERHESLDVLERDPAKLQRIALALGYKGKRNALAGKRLLDRYEKLRARIRRCYERRFRGESQAASAPIAL